MIRCRICGKLGAVSLGKIPDCCVFSGQTITPSIKGGWLWRCEKCDSMFRHPTLTSNEYLSLYEKLPASIWDETTENREDFLNIYSYLESHAGGTILDVGCYTGNFLSGLPGRFQKSGLEPSYSASHYSRSRNIDVLGETLDDLEPNLKFNIVTSIDVIEHLLNIEEFLDKAMSHVKPNGLLIIGSGDPDATYWKSLFKSRYWYCLFPEHVSFPSYKFFCDYAKKNNLQKPERIRFRYMKLNLSARLAMLLNQIAFYISPLIYRLVKKTLRMVKNRTSLIKMDDSILVAGLFLDHHIIVFKKY